MFQRTSLLASSSSEHNIAEEMVNLLVHVKIENIRCSVEDGLAGDEPVDCEKRLKRIASVCMTRCIQNCIFDVLVL